MDEPLRVRQCGLILGTVEDHQGHERCRVVGLGLLAVVPGAVGLPPHDCVGVHVHVDRKVSAVQVAARPADRDLQLPSKSLAPRP